MRSQESPVIGEIVHARPGLLDFLSLPWLPRSTVQIKRSVVWWWVVWVLGGVEIGRGGLFLLCSNRPKLAGCDMFWGRVLYS